MLSFKNLRVANKTRAEEWDPDSKTDFLFSAVELAGEAGEVCNQVKKYARSVFGMQGGDPDVSKIADEIADVLICADLLAIDFDIDLEEALIRKFNQVSEKYGLSTKL